MEGDPLLNTTTTTTNTTTTTTPFGNIKPQVLIPLQSIQTIQTCDSSQLSTDAIVSGRPGALRERVRDSGGKPLRLGVFQTGTRPSRLPVLIISIAILLSVVALVIVIARPSLLLALAPPTQSESDGLDTAFGLGVANAFLGWPHPPPSPPPSPSPSPSPPLPPSKPPYAKGIEPPCTCVPPKTNHIKTCVFAIFTDIHPLPCVPFLMYSQTMAPEPLSTKLSSAASVPKPTTPALGAVSAGCTPSPSLAIHAPADTLATLAAV